MHRIGIIALSFALSALTVQAQEVEEITPEWRVVSVDGAAARSGPQDLFYAVTEFEAGQLVRVDGRVGDQARIRYPDSLDAVVGIGEARDAGGDVAELTKASALRAPSALLGLSASWKALYDEELPVGTRLEIRERLTTDEGEVIGFRVKPAVPPVASSFPRAFIDESALRAATPEEIEAAESGAVQTPEEAAALTESAEEIAPIEDDRMVEGGATDPATMTHTTPDVASDPVGEPVEIPTRAEPRRAPSLTISPSGLEDLEASFESARKLPREQLDAALDELIAEYRRTRGTSGDDERLAEILDQRIEWLALRIETRNQRRAIRAAIAQADERSVALAQQVDSWKSGRAYQLVGRLVESTVYNGERLPKMYRVQAVTSTGGVARTLGYLTPNQELSEKLGSVVGIIGESRFDPALRLAIIRPQQVDVMPE